MQVRTWNLSSIWRLTTGVGLVWLKVTPPFCASEAALMPLLDPASCPPSSVRAHRVLLADVPGQDQYDARGDELRSMVWMLIGLQARGSNARRSSRLSARRQAAPRRPPADPLGRRPPGTTWTTTRGARSTSSSRTAGAVRGADGLRDPGHPGARRLPSRNVRGSAGRYRILDWGDCGIGNPMLTCGPPPSTSPGRPARSDHIWESEWSRQVPGCDARRAPRSSRPLGRLYGAVVYQKFQDNIETTEHPDHEGDPAHALRGAVAMAAGPEGPEARGARARLRLPRRQGCEVTASRTARKKKAAAEAGPLARVKIDLGAHDTFVYKVSCTTCVVRGTRSWSAYRPGGDNGYIAAMDRWVLTCTSSTRGPRRPAWPTCQRPSNACTSVARSRQRRCGPRRGPRPALNQGSTAGRSRPRG